MLVINCADHYNSVVATAQSLGIIDKLESQLEYLSEYASGPGCTYEKTGTKCELHYDSAPLSFSFTMFQPDGNGGWKYWFNGGLIYHGPTAPGDGSAPSFSVDLSGDKAPHWSVHT